MKKNKRFSDLVERFSDEAIERRAEEQAALAAEARREKIKQSIMSAVVAGLFVIVFVKHAEIRDTVAALLDRGPSEREELLALAEEEGDAIADNTTTNDARSARKAQLRALMRQAKEHAKTVDQIMDDSAPPKK